MKVPSQVRTFAGAALESTFWTGRAGQLCVQYFRPGSDVCYQPHIHSEYAIIICLAGQVVVEQLNREQAIGPGEILIGNCGVEQAGRYLAQDGQACEAVIVALHPRLLAELTEDFDLPRMTGETCPAFTGTVKNWALHECAQGIAQELISQQPGHKILIEAQAIRLVVEAIRSWPRSAVSEIEADFSPRLPRRELVRALEFMRRCRKDGFRLQHLCRFLGCSKERFARLFLASTGQTPANYYNRLLLERACTLLRNPKLSIKEIGFELGFRTSSHFTAAFRREYTISPQEHRQHALVPALRCDSVKIIPANRAGSLQMAESSPLLCLSKLPAIRPPAPMTNSPDARGLCLATASVSAPA